jgi:AAA+ superfamily predicted ATPase
MSDRPTKPAGEQRRAQPPARPAVAATPPTAAALSSTSPGAALSRTPRRLDPREELDVLIRARYAIIYVVSWEEDRVERYLREIAQRRKKNLFVWTVTQGISKSGAEPQRAKAGAGSTADPLAALDAVIQHVEPAIYLFKDFHRFSCDDRCNIAVIRRLRDLAHHLRDTYKTLVIVAPALRIAPDLAKDVTVLEFGLPDIDDFARLLDRIIEDVRDNPKVQIDLGAEDRERLLHAARGLTLKEAENVFAKTLVLDGRLNSEDISVIFSEKQQIIKKSGLLEYYEAQEDFSHVAGLENLKHWLIKRQIAFSERATRFGLPSPRGVMLLGVQGCGKSLCAKAVSSLWNLPLLRFDIGQMFSSLVGSSEENVRRAIQTAESVAPVILWIDEIDKALAGSSGGGSSDAGTASRVFGTLLTWLSEKTSEVFVICTANDISHLPPELLRKGRLDEIFFVDLPDERERREILQIHLRKRQRDPAQFALDELVRLSEGFSGAEIEEAIIAALFDALSQQQDLDTELIAASLRETVPLSKTMSEQMTVLRSWAAGRARPASLVPQRREDETSRKIEF